MAKEFCLFQGSQIGERQIKGDRGRGREGKGEDDEEIVTQVLISPSRAHLQ